MVLEKLKNLLFIIAFVLAFVSKSFAIDFDLRYAKYPLMDKYKAELFLAYAIYAESKQTVGLPQRFTNRDAATLIEYFRDATTGINMGIYKLNNQKWVVAFGGTTANAKEEYEFFLNRVKRDIFNKLDVVKDFITDLNLLQKRGKTYQPYQAYAKFEEWKEKYNLTKDNTTLTGHSLGGGLVQHVSKLTGYKGVTLNTAPCPIQYTFISLDDLNLSKEDANVINFMTNKDPLTSILKLVEDIENNKIDKDFYENSNYIYKMLEDYNKYIKLVNEFNSNLSDIIDSGTLGWVNLKKSSLYKVVENLANKKYTEAIEELKKFMDIPENLKLSKLILGERVLINNDVGHSSLSVLENSYRNIYNLALERIKSANPLYYSYIDGTFREEDKPPLYEDSNLHKDVEARLSYYFYIKAYEPLLDSKIHIIWNNIKNIENTQKEIEDFANRWLNVNGIITETTLLTYNSLGFFENIDNETKRKIISNLLDGGKTAVYEATLPKDAKAVVDVVENCIGGPKWPLPSLGQDLDDNIIFENVKKVIDCAAGETVKATGRFVNSMKGFYTLGDYISYSVAKKYLDVFYECGINNETCLNNHLGGNSTLNTQLQYIINDYDLGYGFSNTYVKGKAFYYIEKYKKYISSLVDDTMALVSKDVKREFNYSNRYTNTLQAKVKNIKYVKDFNSILFDVTIKNISGRTIELEDANFVIVSNGKEKEVSSSLMNSILNKDPIEPNKSRDIKDLLVSLDDFNVSNFAKFVMTINYKSNDQVFTDYIQEVANLNISEITKEYKEYEVVPYKDGEENNDTIAKTTIILPENASLDGNILSADLGEMIEFMPTYSAKNFIECVNQPYSDNPPKFWTTHQDGSQEVLTLDKDSVVYKVKYYDVVNNKFGVVEANYDINSGKFSFTMPSNKIIISNVSLKHKDNDDTAIICKLPEKLESILDRNDSDNNLSIVYNIDWEKQIKAIDYVYDNYNYGHIDEGKNIVLDSNGNIFVSGNTLGGLDGNNTQNGNGLIFLGKFTADGKKVWFKQYGKVGEHYEVHSMVLDTDDNIYISGWIGFGGMDARPLILKYDKDGNLIWKKEFPINYGYDESLNEIQLMSDGIILIRSRSGRQLNDKEYIIIEKFSFDGDTLWTKELDGNNSIQFISSTKQNNMIYILANERNNLTIGNMHKVYKIDSNGNIIDNLLLNFDQKCHFNKISIYKNNLYILATNTLYKVDFNGNMIWKRESVKKEGKFSDTFSELKIHNDVIYIIGSTNEKLIHNSIGYKIDTKDVLLSIYSIEGNLIQSSSYIPHIMKYIYEPTSFILRTDNEMYILGYGAEKTSSNLGNITSSVLFKIKKNLLFNIEKNIELLYEDYLDNSIITTPFTKSWTFNKDITNLTIDIVDNSYQNSISEADFIKNGKTLKVNLTPNSSETINKLTLQFKDSNGKIVTVNGSPTFWSLTRTNNPPRLADGQITQLVSSTNEPAFLEIETFDADGDNVSLSVKDDAGGYVGFDPKNPKRLFASFNDGKSIHTIKIALDDGKEKVIKRFNVLQFNQNSIENFYSDVRKDANDYPYDGIYFGTLKGVIWGEPDSSNTQKRVFRPRDNATYAEALKMILEAEKRAKLIDLKTTNLYRDIEPAWAMPYYTYAVDNGAMDKKDNIAYSYITREEVAKLVVKSLNLDAKIKDFDLNITFSDEDEFSSPQYLYYAKVAKYFGLFMNENSARAKEFIKRADLAVVIEKIFMLPTAKLNLNPNSGEYKESFSYELKDINAQKISSDGTKIIDNSKNLKSYILVNKKVYNQKTIDNKNLNIGSNKIYAILENSGVKNISEATYTMNYYDSDNDGIEDKEDAWKDDSRYAFDDNNNGIPDILDFIYDLSNYKATDTVTINNQKVAIRDIIEKGMIPETTNNQDTDNDGIPDDKEKELGLDPNNPDTDGDGISDKDEIKYGLDPKDSSDANKDNDGDGVSNIDEIKAGTNPNDKTQNVLDINLSKNSIVIHHNRTDYVSFQLSSYYDDKVTLDINSKNDFLDIQKDWSNPIEVDKYKDKNLTVGLKVKDDVSLSNDVLLFSLEDEHNHKITKELNVTILEKYELYIPKGWSLKSLPTNQTVDAYSFRNSTILWKWDKSEKNWLAWSPDSDIRQKIIDNSIELFYTIKPSEGFWIKSEKDYTKNFEGDIYGFEKINLTQGWNLVGVGKDITVDEINDVAIKYIWLFRDGKWMLWGKSLAQDNYKKFEKIKTIKAGEGFWILSNKP